MPLKFASWSRISKLFCRKCQIRFCNEGRRVESLPGGCCVSLLCVLAAPQSGKCVEGTCGSSLSAGWRCLCAPLALCPVSVTWGVTGQAAFSQQLDSQHSLFKLLGTKWNHRTLRSPVCVEHSCDLKVNLS